MRARRNPTKSTTDINNNQEQEHQHKDNVSSNNTTINTKKEDDALQQQQQHEQYHYSSEQNGSSKPSLSTTSTTTATSTIKKPKMKQQSLFSCLLFLISVFSIIFYKSELKSMMISLSNNEVSEGITMPFTRINAKKRIKSTMTMEEEKTLRSSIKSKLQIFQEMKHDLLDTFYKRYGGKKSAMELYEKGLYTFDDESNGNGGNGKKRSIEYTATRILSSLSTSKPFHFSFGGYSVTVGRGNYFHQSYPFVLERTLTEIFESVNIDLNVHNGAIGGTPSFPYGWCLKNYMGITPNSDFISWDFSMNEGRSAMGLEAYIRQAIVMFENPMIMLLDNPTSKGGRARYDLLHKYIAHGTLGPDAIILNPDFSYIPKELFTQKKPAVPEGLNHWADFGAPEGAPGKQSWHLTYQQHELIGWLLSIYFLQSLDVAMDYLFKPDDYDWSVITTKVRKESINTLPPPMSVSPDTTTDPNSNALSSLFGRPSPTNSSHYIMNRISCISSYHPTKHGDLGLSIVEGLGANLSDTLLTETSQQIYLDSKGWMHDIGKLERDTKKKLIKFDQLGYIDLKAAYYGIPQSGTLMLSIPIAVDDNEAKTELLRNKFQIENNAKTFIKSLIICQVNEKRTDNECNLEKNLQVIAGNAPITYRQPKLPPSKLTTITFPGALYLNKPLCVSVEIHDDAEIFVGKGFNKPSTSTTVQKSQEITRRKRGTLSVEISVIGDNVSYDNGACSISHVIIEYDSTIFPLGY